MDETPIDEIDDESEYYRLTLEALADVDAGHVIPHQAIQAWAATLTRTNRCLCRNPDIC